jgi:hypothetical protein
MGYVEPVNEEGYDGGYLTLTALVDTTFTFVMGSNMGTGDLTGIYYSVDDGDSWVYTANVDNQEVSATTPLIHKGEHVLWKGVNKRPSRARSSGGYSHFTSDGKFAIGGTLASLIWGDDYETKFSTKDWNSFTWLFYQSKLVNAKNLRFTITTLSPGTYQALFQDCAMLKVPPTEISIGVDVYQQMFYGCTSLISSPDILISKLVSNNLKEMFSGCTSLKYIKILSTDISASNCLQNWVQNVPSGGTFVKAAGVTYSSGASGIPNGWTVEEEIV